MHDCVVLESAFRIVDSQGAATDKGVKRRAADAAKLPIVLGDRLPRENTAGPEPANVATHQKRLTGDDRLPEL